MGPHTPLMGPRPPTGNPGSATVSFYHHSTIILDCYGNGFTVKVCTEHSIKMQTPNLCMLHKRLILDCSKGQYRYDHNHSGKGVGSNHTLCEDLSSCSVQDLLPFIMQCCNYWPKKHQKTSKGHAGSNFWDVLVLSVRISKNRSGTLSLQVCGWQTILRYWPHIPLI